MTSVGVIPSGKLAAIRWYRGPLLYQCTLPAAEQPGTGPQCPSYKLFSWSNGYVVFAEAWEPVPNQQDENVISVSASTDGLHWTRFARIWTGYITIENLVEGPAGLLAIGYTTSKPTCGQPDTTIHGLWLSRDGVSWTSISMSASFGGHPPDTISASSHGYMATGGWSGPELWLSTDAKTWTRPTLPFAMYRSATVRGPVAFDGGYIVYGEVIVPAGCGGPYLSESAVWFSQAGSTWTRETLPGGVAAADVSTSAQTVTQSVLLAHEQARDAHGTTVADDYWTSTDGQIWTRFDTSSFHGQSWLVFSNGQEALVQTTSSDPATDTTAAVTWYTLGIDLKPARLSDSDNDPVFAGAQCALGPTGIVALVAAQVWIGVLSA